MPLPQHKIDAMPEPERPSYPPVPPSDATLAAFSALGELRKAVNALAEALAVLGRENTELLAENAHLRGHGTQGAPEDLFRGTVE
jgi:hypothetical protein